VLSRMYVESWWQSIVLEGRYLPGSRSSGNYGRHFQDLATSRWCRRVLRISSIGSGCDAGWQEAFLQAITAIATVQIDNHHTLLVPNKDLAVLAFVMM
jgi:hypothetical protein